MAVEIERKFLVTSGVWRTRAGRGLHIADYLIAHFETGKARIRVCEDTAVLTFKGRRKGFSRSEYHMPLPAEEADAMVAEFATGPALEKLRYEIDVSGVTWQVDEYQGALSGLVTADVELPGEGYALTMPEWAGAEITHDPRYSSGTLAAALLAGAPSTLEFVE